MRVFMMRSREMNEGKIEVRMGDVQFIAEGETTWITEQLEKFLDKAPEIMSKLSQKSRHFFHMDDAEIAEKALVTFLDETSTADNQREKFLATAIWLQARGKSKLKTNDVTTALRENNQAALTNPAECLRANAFMGYCEKDGNHFFYVTEDGKRSII